MDHHRERPPAGIRWHDLAPMSRIDTWRELTLPLPWLALSLALYATPVPVLGLPASFVMFLCALRLNHEAIHGNLGLTAQGDATVLHVLSGLMLSSNHAVAHGHRLHHADTMGPRDFEGRAGEMGFLEVLAYGPRFAFDINRHAWTAGRPALRRRMALDWALNLTGPALALLWPVLWWHVAAMGVAQGLTALFAVWITHHGAHGIAARSQRGPVARLAYLMFYHREHHLFPKVPVRRLPDLARRLDEGVPGYADAHLPVVPFLDRRAA